MFCSALNHLTSRVREVEATLIVLFFFHLIVTDFPDSDALHAERVSTEKQVAAGSPQLSDV